VIGTRKRKKSKDTIRNNEVSREARDDSWRTFTNRAKGRQTIQQTTSAVCLLETRPFPSTVSASQTHEPRPLRQSCNIGSERLGENIQRSINHKKKKPQEKFQRQPCFYEQRLKK
jgi:hypothetical protein